MNGFKKKKKANYYTKAVAVTTLCLNSSECKGPPK